MSRFHRVALIAVGALALVASSCAEDDETADAVSDTDRSSTSTTAEAADSRPETSEAATETGDLAETGSAYTVTTTQAAPECGSGGSLDGPTQERTFTASDGTERAWLLALPGSYREGTPSPVVFNLHGRGSTATEQYVYGNFVAQAERNAVILVMPQALGGTVDPRVRWNSRLTGDPRPDHDVDDVSFLMELAEQVASEYCTSEFFAVGMSSGGAMTTALGCLADGPFEAIAPVTLSFYTSDPCADAPPRPFVYFHGTEDDTVPFAGAPATAQAWADHNGCDPEPVEERIGTEVLHYAWNDCDASTDFYVIEGGGHSWPGSIEVPGLGHVTTEISASDVIWDTFFGVDTGADD